MITRVRVRMRIEIKIELTEKGQKWFEIRMEMRTMIFIRVFHIQQYGTHLKANAALVRLRLYDVLGLLPPTLYEDKFGPLLRELVAEFTLTDNPANTTTSLLRAMCHADDNVIMGKMCCTMYMNFACDCI